MHSQRIAEVEAVARAAVKCPRNADDETKARAKAASAVLWAIAAWRNSRGHSMERFRARRIAITWGALRTRL